MLQSLKLVCRTHQCDTGKCAGKLFGDADGCHEQAKLNQAKKYRAAAMPAVGSGDGDRAYRDMVSDPSAPPLVI